jgi:hypothetical protein
MYLVNIYLQRIFPNVCQLYFDAHKEPGLLRDRRRGLLNASVIVTGLCTHPAMHVTAPGH